MRKHLITALTFTAVLAAGQAQGVVINEFHYGTPSPGDNEWIELYNLSSMDIDLAGWTIAVANDSGFVTTHTITTGRDTGASIPGNGYFLVTDGTGGTGDSQPDESGVNLNLGRDTGTAVYGIVLVDDAGTSIDTVLYAPAGATNVYNLKDDDGETTLTRVLLVVGDQSHERINNHQDTNNSNVDFAGTFGPGTPVPVEVSRFTLE